MFSPNIDVIKVNIIIKKQTKRNKGKYKLIVFFWGGEGNDQKWMVLIGIDEA